MSRRLQKFSRPSTPLSLTASVLLCDPVSSKAPRTFWFWNSHPRRSIVIFQCSSRASLRYGLHAILPARDYLLLLYHLMLMPTGHVRPNYLSKWLHILDITRGYHLTGIFSLLSVFILIFQVHVLYLRLLRQAAKLDGANGRSREALLPAFRRRLYSVAILISSTLNISNSHRPSVRFELHPLSVFLSKSTRRGRTGLRGRDHHMIPIY